MATKFSQLYKQELKSQGILSSLGSAALKQTRQRMDIRNTLFGGSGIMSLTGQKIFGKGYSGSALSSSPTNTSSAGNTQGISELLASSDRQESLLRVIGKNTFNMNMMARDTNITRQNIITLTKKMTGRASRSQDALWSGAGVRNKSLSSYKDKKENVSDEGKSPTSAAGSSSMIGSLVGGILGFGGSMLSGIAGIAGTIGTGILGAIGSIATLSPLLAVIGIAATSYVLKKISQDIDFSGIADNLAKTIGIDLKSPKSILQQFAENLDKMFNTKAFTETLTWAKTAFAPVIDTLGKHIATISDIAIVYTKAAYMNLAETFGNLGQIFGFLFSEFFNNNKGKIFAAMTIGMLGPALFSAKGAAVAGLAAALAGAFGAATGEDSREEMKQKIDDKNAELAKMGGREDAQIRLSKGGLNDNNNAVKLLKEILELESIYAKKDAAYKKAIGDFENSAGKFGPNFTQKVEDLKKNLPGGTYGGGYQSAPPSDPNAPLRISSDFGFRAHPITGRGSWHEGVDIPMNEGDNVYAAEKGRVKISSSASGYGNMIEIDHGNGKTTRYAHLKSMNVAVGDMVERGQKIALAGNTGTSTNPHLHFEERDGNQATRPSPQMLATAVRGIMLNENSVNLANATRTDTSAPNINVLNQQAAAPPPAAPPQNAAASTHNFDPWVEIWSSSILNPAGMRL
jgi:murein DD-endopeptidase MepM/ murein hydrolase activator NlpD